MAATPEVREIVVRYRADASGLDKTLKSMDTSLSRTATSMQKVDQKLSSFATSLKTLAGAWVSGKVLDFAKAMMTAADQAKVLNQQITMLSQGAMNFEGLYNYAQRLGTSLATASQQLNVFLPALRKVGLSTEQSVQFTEDLTKSLRLYGVSGQQAVSVTQQLSQALGSGTLAGEELKALRENAGGLSIEFERAVQQILNTSDSLKTLGSKGQLTAEVVVQAWAVVFDKIRAGFNGIANTIEQQEARVSNAAGKLFAAVDAQLHASDIWKWGLGNVAGNLERLADTLNKDLVIGPFATPTDKFNALIEKRLELMQEFERVSARVAELTFQDLGGREAINLENQRKKLAEIGTEWGRVEQAIVAANTQQKKMLEAPKSAAMAGGGDIAGIDLLKGVNSELAQSVEGFVADAVASGFKIGVNRGLATPAEQADLCKSLEGSGIPCAKKGSKHVLGLAVDISIPKENTDKFKAWAQTAAKEWGLIFPVGKEDLGPGSTHLHAQLEETEKKTRGLTDAQKAAKLAQNEYNESTKTTVGLIGEYRSMVESLETPQETFNRQIRELNELRDQFDSRGFVFDPAVYSKAVEAAREQFDAAIDKTKELKEEMQQFQTVGDAMADAFANGLEEAILSGNKLRDVLKGLLDDLLRIFVRATVTKPLGDLLSGLLSGIGGVFALPARASGGPVYSGSAYLVGEQGPELFVPRDSGTIIPNTRSGLNVIVNTLPGTTARVSETAQGLTIDMVETYIAAAFVAGGNKISRSAEVAYPGLRRGR